MKHLILSGLLIGLASTAFAQIVTTDNYSLGLGAFDSGRYSSAGSHTPSSQNYLTGSFSGETYSGFLAFSVPNIGSVLGGANYDETTSSWTVLDPGSWMRRQDLDISPLESSPLGLENVYAWKWITTISTKTSTRSVSVSPLANLALSVVFGSPWLKTTDGDTLSLRSTQTSANTILAGGSGKVAVYSDLATGVVIGSIVPGAAGFTVNLNGEGVARFVSVAGSGGVLVIGMTLDGAASGEYLFGGTSGASGIGLYFDGDRVISYGVAQEQEIVTNPGGDYWSPYANGNYHHLIASEPGSRDLWYTSDPNNPPGFLPLAVPEVPSSAIAAGTLAVFAFLQRRCRK